MKYSILTVVASFAVLALAAAPGVAASPMATGEDVVPPAGFLGFCVKHLAECTGSAPAPAVVELTDAHERDIEAVQAEVNRSIEPKEDPAHVWDYAVDGRGDCNKFALTKRRELIARGLPREALLLATATTETGEGHLVLVVKTDKGDLVLDNRRTSVVDWSRLPYRWISRQSESRPTEWVRIRG